jgi:hypothetical protein
VSPARKLSRQQARELDVVFAERRHARHCRAPYGIPCTCEPELVVVGHATTDAEARAVLTESLERRKAIMAELERGFS